MNWFFNKKTHTTAEVLGVAIASFVIGFFL
jgi:hypothetical protein